MDSENEKRELDLLDLFRMFFNWLGFCIKSFFKGLLWILKFSFKNWKIIFASVLIGCGISFYFSQSAKSVYEGTIILQNNVAKSADVALAVKALNTKINPDDYNALLSKILEIKRNVGKDIVSIKPYFIYSSDDEKLYNVIDFYGKYTDKKPVSDRLCISVKTRNKRTFPILRNALVKYLSKNDYFQQLNGSRIEQLKMQKKTMEKELLAIDSLERLEYFQANKKINSIQMEGGLLVGDNKTQLYHENILALTDQIEKVKSDLIIKQGVFTVVSDFYVGRANNGKIKLLVYFGLAFYVLGFITALIYRNKKRIVDFLNS